MSSVTWRLALPSQRLISCYFVPLCVALWPVWVWYCQRLSDRSDEPLGIVALITFFVILSVHPERIGESRPTRALTGVLALYAAAIFFVPKLGLACIALALIGLCLGGRRGAMGLTAGDWGLLFLSLPLVSSLNFYFGYPLRLFVAAAAAPLLNINGFAVIAQGTQLIYNGQAVEVDAPCSGVRMLWAALYLAATLASLRGLNWIRGVSFMVLAVVLALFANVLRVTSLFYLETSTINVPHQIDDAVHEGIGVAGFFLLAIALLLLAGRLARRGESPELSEKSDPVSLNEEAVSFPSLKQPAYKAFIAACAICTVLPFADSGRSPAPPAEMPVPVGGWYVSAAGEMLQPLPLTARQGQIAAAFPGDIKIYTAGHKTVVLRWMQQATRQLHPAADCYRAAGYAIKYLPPVTDGQGLRWGATEAKRGAERLLIKERIFDNHGHNWHDVSTWYWAALTGSTNGPWWAVMVVEASPGAISSSRYR